MIINNYVKNITNIWKNKIILIEIYKKIKEKLKIYNPVSIMIKNLLKYYKKNVNTINNNLLPTKLIIVTKIYQKN
jgi:hypothetical protein